jgi:hypothetical protein
MDFNPIEFEFAARRCAIACRTDLFGRYVRGELSFDELGAALGIKPPKAKAEPGAGQAEQSGAPGKVGAGKSPSSVKDTAKKPDSKPLWASLPQQPMRPQAPSFGTPLPWSVVIAAVEKGQHLPLMTKQALQWRSVIEENEREGWR